MPAAVVLVVLAVGAPSECRSRARNHRGVWFTLVFLRSTS